MAVVDFIPDDFCCRKNSVQKGLGNRRFPKWNPQRGLCPLEEKRASPESYLRLASFCPSLQPKGSCTHWCNFLLRESVLEFRIFHSTRVRQYVTDIAYACQVHHGSFKAQPEAGMSCAAVFAQV